jgi:hypothetical protein
MMKIAIAASLIASAAAFAPASTGGTSFKLLEESEHSQEPRASSANSRPALFSS